MRVAVFAYHDIGYVCLQELLRSGDEIAAVITHEDDPGEEVWFRSVAALARQHDLPVYTPATVNTPEWVARLREMRLDFIFSFYYRNLLSADVLALPRLGALNLHGSLLPKFRGRCPVNWVLIHGETESGVTLHYMEAKPDRGDMVAQRRVTIDEQDTALTLFRKLTEAAATLMRETYPLLRDGRAPRIPQDHTQSSYFGGRRPEDGRIDWTHGARQIYNLVRAVTHPYPGAFALWNGKRVFVWEARMVDDATRAEQPGALRRVGERIEAATASGVLEVVRMQLEGEAEMTAREWWQRHGAEAVVCE